MIKVKKALISVSDKTALEGLAKALHRHKIEIISTGGTAKAIKALKIPVKDISEYTNFPEMMDGRVKTLHPKVHGALLALRNNKTHMEEAKKNNIEMIDMVVVNFYPFEKTIAKKNVKLEEAIENIDIGGPSMLRSAAKNYKSVAVVMDPSAYPGIIKELEENKGSLSEGTLEKLGKEVFKRTSEYDKAIYNFLSSHESRAASHETELNLNFEKIQDLRYGENPHQKAIFLKNPNSKECSVTSAKQLQGKELSFNNILDLNATLELVKEFKEPAAAILKHNNPCGVATSDTLTRAYLDALSSDPLSAFGSIVGFNGKVNKKLADTIIEKADFVECVIAPGFDKDAADIFSKKKNLRLLELPEFKKTSKKELDYKKVVGGLLVQDMDLKEETEKDINAVTEKKPDEHQIKALLFAWKVVKHVKSNAIVIAQGTRTVGIGAGQMSRVDSVIIAKRKAGGKSKNAVLASDAFFPKADNIEEAHEAGIKAIIQPGGSKADSEIIAACNKYGIAMIFTGVRHFRH